METIMMIQSAGSEYYALYICMYVYVYSYVCG